MLFLNNLRNLTFRAPLYQGNHTPINLSKKPGFFNLFFRRGNNCVPKQSCSLSTRRSLPSRISSFGRLASSNIRQYSIHVAIGMTITAIAGIALLKKKKIHDSEERLTVVLLSDPLTLDNFDDAMKICMESVSCLRSGLTYVERPFSKIDKQWQTTKVYRNFIARILWDDDKHALCSHLNSKQKEQLEVLLQDIEGFLAKADSSIMRKKPFRELVLMHTAACERLGIAAQRPLHSEEAEKLQGFFREMREKEVHYLLPSYLEQLLKYPPAYLDSLKTLSPEERKEWLDRICPLQLGISSADLNTFIRELPLSAQKQLIPLAERRQAVIYDHDAWQKLVDLRISERNAVEEQQRLVPTKAADDAGRLSQRIAFTDLILSYSECFKEHLFESCCVYKHIPLMTYFESPHVVAFLEEQHLHKQLKAAGEMISEEKIPRIRSSLEKEPGPVKWIPVHQIFVRQVFIFDNFEKLRRDANLASMPNIDDSSRMKKNFICYLPKKGLVNYNPSIVAEKVDSLTPYKLLETYQTGHFFTPVVSYSDEGTTLKATHAFVQLSSNEKFFTIGKFLSHNCTFDQIETYWSLFHHIFRNILAVHPVTILIPDQNIGYGNRRLSVLKKPLELSQGQLEEIYRDVLHYYHGKEGYDFELLARNCTELPQKALRAAGIDLPCDAPLDTLFKFSQPRLAKAIRWAIDHPSIGNTLLWPVNRIFGVNREKGITVNDLNHILTPFVLRLWIELCNSKSEIDGLRKPS